MRLRILLLAIVIHPIFIHAQSDPRLKGLDTFVARVIRDWKIPGVSIAVVEKNKVIFTGGYGYRDIEKKLPVTENTLYAIGSCTKAFTAAILGQLAKEGKVDLDKPVRDYLPELKFEDEYSNAHITLRDMITHRTGLPRHDMSWYASPASRKELLERIEHLEPTAELRETFQYNNFMYLAQGMVIEKITGKSWEQNVKERILDPLGMNNTHFSVKEMMNAADKSYAYATIKDSIIKQIPYRNIDAMGPAGSINSCAKDMAKWLITWINDGKYNGKEIIPALHRMQAMTSQMATGAGVPGIENPDVHAGGYGLGWFITSYRGHYRVEHGGGIDGFITTTGFFPGDSIGIFVVSNQSQPVSIIRNFIADRMMKLPYRNWNKQMLDAATKAREAAKSGANNDSLQRKKNTKPTHDLSDYAGIYENPGYGEIQIMSEDGKLKGKYNTLDLELDHYHYNIFNARAKDPAFETAEALKMMFTMNVRGEISALTIPFQAGAKDIEFNKQPPKLEVRRSDIARYAGKYEISGLEITVYIKDEKTLMMSVPGQPEYELIPTAEHEFNLKDVDGFSVRFETNERKEVTALYSIQPNGTFKATRK